MAFFFLIRTQELMNNSASFLGMDHQCDTELARALFKARVLLTARLDPNANHMKELARKLHAHSVKYANKVVTIRRAVENKKTLHSQVLEPDALRKEKKNYVGRGNSPYIN
eukprot:1158293-Pelagomonas_calceolata.AAC.1